MTGEAISDAGNTRATKDQLEGAATAADDNDVSSRSSEATPSKRKKRLLVSDAESKTQRLQQYTKNAGVKAQVSNKPEALLNFEHMVEMALTIMKIDAIPEFVRVNTALQEAIEAAKQLRDSSKKAAKNLQSYIDQNAREVNSKGTKQLRQKALGEEKMVAKRAKDAAERLKMKAQEVKPLYRLDVDHCVKEALIKPFGSDKCTDQACIIKAHTAIEDWQKNTAVQLALCTFASQYKKDCHKQSRIKRNQIHIK